MAKVNLADRLSTTRTRIQGESGGPPALVLPKFAQLTRKEARVREDQYAALSTLARTLMRHRTIKDERITENTLIRVAIDLLLVHGGRLAGSTEDELRASVTSEVPESGTSELSHIVTPKASESKSLELR
jgi:hypothetical protein